MSQKYKTYDIHCAHCGQYVLTYHKYGAGKGILRLYLSNIAAPKELARLQYHPPGKVNQLPNLSCPECYEVLGVPAVSKGKKWAYRMRQGYFHRKLRKMSKKR